MYVCVRVCVCVCVCVCVGDSIAAVTNDPTGRDPEIRLGLTQPPLPLTPIPPVLPTAFDAYLATVEPLYAAFARDRAEARQAALADEQDPACVLGPTRACRVETVRPCTHACVGAGVWGLWLTQRGWGRCGRARGQGGAGGAAASDPGCLLSGRL
jgi:hypothetical protein